MSRFDFYYGVEADQFSFYRIPKELFTNDYFRDMSTDAKLLYGLLLDRMSLSRKNGWFDDENRVYIIYKVAEIQEALNCGKNKAVALLKELEKYNLMLRVKIGFSKPDLIYVYNIFKQIDTENVHSDAENTCYAESAGFDFADTYTNNKNDISDLKIDAGFIKGQACPVTGFENQTNGGLKNKPHRFKNQTNGGLKNKPRGFENQTSVVYKSNPNKTNISYINNSYIDSSNNCSCSYIPDLQDIKNYINNNNYTFSPEYFYNYYAGRKWCLGNKPIDDFESLKAIMDNWQLKEKNKQQAVQAPKGAFNNYSQKIYTKGELEEIVRRKEGNWIP